MSLFDFSFLVANRFAFIEKNMNFSENRRLNVFRRSYKGFSVGLIRLKIGKLSINRNYKKFDIYSQNMLKYLTYIDSKQVYQMFYQSLTTLIHENCLCTFIGLGAVLIGISICRAGVGL